MYALILVTIAPDAPPADALRFGVSREIVEANQRTAEKHRAFLCIEPDQFWGPWYFAQRNYSICWDCLSDAFDPVNTMEYRIERLHTLRKYIGNENYLAGRMPPAICHKPWIPPPKGK